ncbi:MAG TPA: hypothetical protein PK771_09340 [Spirochaetota bacterium]|nr:hypothetical protein [Spirochaetota bacterium]
MLAVKEEAKKMVENLPENATWDDLMYQLYVRKKVEKALKQAENGEIVSHEEVKKRENDIVLKFVNCFFIR